VRKGVGKGRIGPALGDPARVPDETKGAQGLDQAQPALFEGTEGAVGVHQDPALTVRLGVATGQQHPDVVHGGPDQHVVEVEEEEAGVAQQQVAHVAVAVDRVHRHPLGPGIVERDDLQDGGAVAGRAARRQEAPRLEQRERRQGHALGIQTCSRARAKRLANVVNAGEQAAEHADLLVVQLVGRSASGAGPDREVDAVGVAERLAPLEHQRHADRDLGALEGQEHPVLLEDRGPAPAPGAVELRHQVPVLVDAHVVDPVLEGIEGEAVAGGPVARRLDGLQDTFRREAEEGLRVRHGASIPHAPPGAALALVCPERSLSLIFSGT
jgi:hypothetical protein